jgi:hypothetical protein
MMRLQIPLFSGTMALFVCVRSGVQIQATSPYGQQLDRRAEAVPETKNAAKWPRGSFF